MLLTLALVCAVGAPMNEMPREETTIVMGGLAVTLGQSGLVRIADPASGEVLLEWPGGDPGWYFMAEGNYTPLSPGRPAGCTGAVTGSHVAAESLRIHFTRDEAPAVEGTLFIMPRPEHGLDLRLQVTNKSGKTISVIGFPGGFTTPGGADRYLVYPFQSGALLPLDDRFDDMKLYNQLPFIHGYPGNLTSMQWMGVQGPDTSVMIMGLDRYGWLHRMGAVRGEKGIRLVREFDAELPPGEKVTLPAMRIVNTGAGGYTKMAQVYRDWVREKESTDSAILRGKRDGVDRIPLQFIPLDARRKQRPGVDRLKRTHGYPEHAVRSHQGKHFACTPYGAMDAFMTGFEARYGSKVAPQLWSFTRSEDDGGWPLLPIDPLAESALTIRGRDYPALAFHDFMTALRARDDVAVLYTNPTFMKLNSPAYRADLAFDTAGNGKPRMGGLAAQASEDSAYVCPSRVQAMQAGQIAGVVEAGGGQLAGALMYDSSQAIGGTLFSNSLIRHDAHTDIDRNPAAGYVDRYGYVGRDSYVQDRIKRDVALHEASPTASKGGEWISELTTPYLDINAGSICLRREYPDDFERPNHLIPVPLYQMVYGDCQYFTIRVGAASDANLGGGDPKNTLPAEMARRATALFGGVHQVFHWGGIPWGGMAQDHFNGRTFLVTRDNIARDSLLGRRTAYAMLDAEGEPTVDFFAVRATRWLDDDGKTLAWHFDNNTGAGASVKHEGAALDLWGADAFVPQSLDRLKQGATATLMADGRFALWNACGVVSWPGGAVEVTDSLPSTEGLCVVWDGELLSIGNSAPEARQVAVHLAAPAASKLAPSTRFAGVQDTARIEQDGAGTRVFVKLPAAGTPERYEIPTTLAVFSAGG